MRALLIGTAPDRDLGYQYCDREPYDAVVLGSVTLGQLMGFREERVLEALGEGKPVLLGAKNAYGKQHWVVITGFTGGELRAAGFTIRDPGSKARVNLQQFLDAYPNFYKYFYY